MSEDIAERSDPGISDVLRVASAVRSFLEVQRPFWRNAGQGYGPRPTSAALSARSSRFLEQVFAYDMGLYARVVYGAIRNRKSGPAFGVWEKHAWLETCGQILDLSADAFGRAPFAVCDVGHADYREGDTMAAPRFRAERQRASDQIWRAWLRSTERALCVDAGVITLAHVDV